MAALPSTWLPRTCRKFASRTPAQRRGAGCPSALPCARRSLTNGPDAKRAGAMRHLVSITLLPGVVAVALPALILGGSDVVVDPLRAAFGLLLIGVGLVLAVWTIELFATEGRGTLAPWDATTRLVVRGPYRHVRNPMITGVACILAGEALVFGSWHLVFLLGVFALVNAIYMPLIEEPGLRRRFGGEYDVYRANVPRWLPRLRPFNGREGT
jgi:protein-S-isoprenylcysteine O-methyltransferase Ste14